HPGEGSDHASAPDVVGPTLLLNHQLTNNGPGRTTLRPFALFCSAAVSAAVAWASCPRCPSLNPTLPKPPFTHHIPLVPLHLQPTSPCVSFNLRTTLRGRVCTLHSRPDWTGKKPKSTPVLIPQGFRSTSPSSWTATVAGPSGATCLALPDTAPEWKPSATSSNSPPTSTFPR